MLLLKNFTRGYSKAKLSICFVECVILISILRTVKCWFLLDPFPSSLPLRISGNIGREHRRETGVILLRILAFPFETATCVLPFNIHQPSLPSLSQTFSSSHLEWMAALEGMLPETKQRRLKRMPPWRRRGDIYDNLPYDWQLCLALIKAFTKYPGPMLFNCRSIMFRKMGALLLVELYGTKMIPCPLKINSVEDD